MFLVATVIGSGIMASNLTADVGVQLLANSLITAAALMALILTIQPVSAAFKPLVTAVEAACGGISWPEAGAVVIAQVTGGIFGAVLANLMFDLDAVSISHHERSGSGLWLGEIVATLGHVMVVFGAIASGRTVAVAFAVGGYVVAAYWFTSSTSFANPAVTIARMFSDTVAGIEPASVPMFVLVQAVGATLAVALIRVLYPRALTRLSTPPCRRPREGLPHERKAHRPSRLCPPCRPLPDGCRLSLQPRRRPDRGPVGGLTARQ